MESPFFLYSNVPQVLAAGAGGYLRSGQYIDAGNVTHNKLLNTTFNAVGIRNADESKYDSFGPRSRELPAPPQEYRRVRWP